MSQAMPRQGSLTEEQRLVHELGNSLSAARLRLDMVLGDLQCDEAARTNLAALTSALDGARRLADQLESLVWGQPPEGEQASAPLSDR
ncbi:MAG TPA: hypothetical protein VGG33_16845 [Polyangia bacterium]